MGRIATVLSVLLMCSRTHAQTVEQWLKWGDAAMAQQEYYGASRFYSGALEIEPGRMALQWKQAEASRLSNQYDKAADLYERVYRKDQGRTYPDALRWLGEMQLNVLWEEIMKRFPRVEVTGDPKLVYSSFVHGIKDLPVTLRED